MTVRKMLEERERSQLSPMAFLSENTRGRQRQLSPDDMRTEFQRDRDRITHSKAFRRLMHKTQVFLSPEHDHYRTRLTHTLEVTQIARTICRSLSLNEDLTEAIALGHDLGHTPFGHAGERTIQKLYDSDFTHCKQSLRVVDKLENLNLTYEVRNGILNHAGSDRACTLEGLAVKFADRIAYINHDIDDAVRAGILTIEDIPKELRKALGQTHGERIETMVSSVINASRDIGLSDLVMDEPCRQATEELRAFLFANVYTNPEAKGEEGKACDMLEHMYGFFLEHPEMIARELHCIIEQEGKQRAVVDYISGMTDRYAINKYKQLFVPRVWGSDIEEM